MTVLFTQHPRTWHDNRYVYPVVSRRSRGLSIGVNLNPDKACNFDCSYCSVDRTQPGDARPVDLEVLGQELAHMLSLAQGALWAEAPFSAAPPALRRINDIAFSGDGEPTAEPCFPEALKRAVQLLDWPACAGVKVVVITNATLLERPNVAQALMELAVPQSEIWAKLYAGEESLYQAVDRSKVPLSRVLDNIRALGRRRPVVMQSLFCTLHGQAPSDPQINAWQARIRELVQDGCAIDRVQVYTTARATAESWVGPLSLAQLDAIADPLRQDGVRVETFA